MDCDKDKSADNETEKKEACASCELSQETKELCGQIGRCLARIGDTLNSQLRLTRNGQNLRLNCRDRERLNDDETRLRTGINKLPKTGEGEKQSARGTMGGKQWYRFSPFSSSTARFAIFIGIPSGGLCGGER
ncbi:unnamed protein product [Porites lobata]|uniref:Uncharacterized protein n=1 Tax=Porites lobata TaxID=104759 RepID=A0ABN8R3Q1_9CNID|nr:unnamed protein product [Porites lobata]